MVPKLILLFTKAGWSGRPYSISFGIEPEPDLHRLVGISLDDLPVVETNRDVSNRNFRTLIKTFRTFLRTFFIEFRLFWTFEGRKSFRLFRNFRFLDLNFDFDRSVEIFELFFFDHFRTFELLKFFFRHFSFEGLLSDFLDGDPLVEVVVAAAAAVAAVAVVAVVVVVAVVAQASHDSLQMKHNV